jgi:copper chaperone CopZ
MKNLFILIVIVWFASKANAQFTKASLEASGLTCAMCTKAVKKALEGIPFVQEVKVNIKTQLYELAFKNGIPVHFDDIQKAVQDAGYSIASLKVTGNFDNIKVQKNAYVKIGDQTLDFMNGDTETLSGERTLTLIDKNFLTPKAFKKYSATIKQNSVVNTRIYHVII